jgi:hypothetical protein
LSRKHEETMKRVWKLFLAWTRLSEAAVCEMSQGAVDFHDYPDSTTPEPLPFRIHTCARCGKRFGM